ncbi:HU family DNA-binding protein [Polaribacter glomeratus]|uniref:DNA-binding protein n=1 Tax=Polaribacter glomeratus TaxID=102 RepID=A0A2S7WWA1_9FLAO|nr:HU family DNA-binding protein [Polaribacter glomeratus]PQJ81756.1 DNA-binding protein [Polaribacter glomeratus]TXD66319.1 DNA-binding protein [Polaribacter glomeratus]
MVKIIAISKSNPQDRVADNKFYAQAVGSGKTDLERLAYLVAHQSTVREGDCYAVILSLIHNIVDELKQGKIVKLDKLGTFNISVSSEAEETADEVSANSVKDVRIKFRPDKRIKSSLNIKTIDFTTSNKM